MQYLHSMIRVLDIDKNLAFFCGALGMVETRRIENENGRFTLVFLSAAQDKLNAEKTSSPLLELTYNWDEKEAYSIGRNFGHLAYLVDNIYELCQNLKHQGVVIHRPPRDGHMAFIKSPEGISIELLQKGESLPPQEPWLSMENQGSW